MRTSLSWYSPDPPFWVESPSAAIRPCEVEVDAVAAVLVVDGEDLLADVLLVAPGLVCPVVALDRVVADEGLLHQDQFTFELAISSSAGHALLPSGVFALSVRLVCLLDLIAPIIALETIIILFPTLSGPLPSTAVPTLLLITRSALPVGLIFTDD